MNSLCWRRQKKMAQPIQEKKAIDYIAFNRFMYNVLNKKQGYWQNKEKEKFNSSFLLATFALRLPEKKILTLFQGQKYFDLKVPFSKHQSVKLLGKIR